jgi:putative Mg2+ transporter-C (MgtC) family protein
MELREVTYLAVILRLVVAMICGGAIGLERGLKNRPAGMRTYMLVCVGSCLVMLTNQYLFQVSQAGDPMRLGAQVVSGIGFLGAGTIIVTRHSQIKGLTTAAGLWASAGVGLALGVGFYEAALTSAFVIFFVMTALQRWDDKLHRNTKVMEVYLALEERVGLSGLIASLREMNVEIYNVQIEQEPDPEEGVRTMVATLKSKKSCDHAILLEKIRKVEGVRYLEEL